jgi:hypothetical protein
MTLSTLLSRSFPGLLFLRSTAILVIVVIPAKCPDKMKSMTSLGQLSAVPLRLEA